jgi:hypothetical protein
MEILKPPFRVQPPNVTVIKTTEIGCPKRKPGEQGLSIAPQRLTSCHEEPTAVRLVPMIPPSVSLFDVI